MLPSIAAGVTALEPPASCLSAPSCEHSGDTASRPCSAAERPQQPPPSPSKEHTHTHIHNAHGPGSCHCVPQPELSTVHFGASPETLSDCFPGPIYGGFVRTTVGYCCFSESLFKKQNAVPGQAGNNEDKRMFLTTLFSRSERTMNAIVRNPLFFHLFIY